MKPVKIAMLGLTHGHTRKYYQTLLDNQKLDCSTGFLNTFFAESL